MYGEVPGVSAVQARRAERRCACFASCVCLVLITSFAFYLANRALVARELGRLIDDTFAHVSTSGSVALLGLAVCATSIIPSPLHPLTLLAAGYIFGFWLGLVMLPFAIVGDCIFFLLARRACKESSAVIVASPWGKRTCSATNLPHERRRGRSRTLLPTTGHATWRS